MIKPFLGGALAALLTLACASPADAADANKVIRYATQSAESGFDCQAESDELTSALCNSIFDPLLQYDHLARPIKLQPRTAIALPDISADGTPLTSLTDRATGLNARN